MRRFMGIGLGVALAAATVIGLPATASAQTNSGHHGSFSGGSFHGGSGFRGGNFRGGPAFRGGNFRGGFGFGVSVNPYYYAPPAYYYGYGCSPYYSPYNSPYCAY